MGLEGVNRPVGDQGKTRYGNKDFSDLVHESLDRVLTLASQAVNLELGNFYGLEIVPGLGTPAPGRFMACGPNVAALCERRAGEVSEGGGGCT